ncbi:MAG: universal stress protein [Ktedonobacteraceae bacterium]|nr:universal stress protein [Ktedonobacteraceae bacterium]
MLVAYDGSAGARRALDAALDLARLMHAEVWALAVEERLPRLAATVGEMEEEKSLADWTCEEMLEQASLYAQCKGVELRRVIRAGQVACTIIDVASEHDVDIIVLGHSAHTSIWQRVVGTTAEKVSRHARCHVLLVR